MQLEFRLANSADIELLLDFMCQFYSIDSYPFDAHLARPTMQQIIEDTSLGRVWLIYHQEMAIGYVVLTFGFSLEYHGRDAFIDELFLLPAHRGQGIGSQVMHFVLDACPALSIHALHLEVERTNLAGLRLYRKYGFEEHDRSLMTRWIE